jgi:hypothetical protein
MPLDVLDLTSRAPLWLIAAVLYPSLLATMFAGRWVRMRRDRRAKERGQVDKGQEGYVISAVLGLLALLLGFTFALAVDRFDVRRRTVLQEANAISTTYLRIQLLDEPYRARLSQLVDDYVDNRLDLANAAKGDVPPLLAKNDRLIVELWAETKAAFPTMKDYEFSSTFLDAMNRVVELDATRKTARLAHVPTEVFVILVIYQTVAAGVLGYVLVGRQGRGLGLILVLMFGLSLLLIIDIDRPTLGGIRESQAPMERLRQTLATWRPNVFDKPGDDLSN